MKRSDDRFYTKYTLLNFEQCFWAVDGDLKSIYALSVRDLAVHSKHNLDALVVAMVRYDREARYDNTYHVKRSVLTAAQGTESFF